LVVIFSEKTLLQMTPQKVLHVAKLVDMTNLSETERTTCSTKPYPRKTHKEIKVEQCLVWGVAVFHTMHIQQEMDKFIPYQN